MTLREALQKADRPKVFKLINRKDSCNAAKYDRPLMEQTVASYTKVMDELLSKPKVKADKMPWVVREEKDWLDGHTYCNVGFINPNYVAPAEGLKPWGGKPPMGYYNCNAEKHNKYFAAGFIPWSKVIDTPIINEAGYPLEKMVAELLWEITFYGWSEDKNKAKVKEIKGKISEAIKDVKAGRCVEIPAEKKDGYKIVIPETVTKQIKELTKKWSSKNKDKKKKCNTCWGYGVWVMGDASPMGPMDASDGMPTKACPECGANPNPIKKK